jgi:membrane protease subunit (stomatin/prohibitin family)
MKPSFEILKNLRKGDKIIINSEKYEIEDFDSEEGFYRIILSEEGFPLYSGAGVRFILKYNLQREIKFIKISDVTGSRFGAMHVKKFGGKITYPKQEEIEIKNFNFISE